MIKNLIIVLLLIFCSVKIFAQSKTIPVFVSGNDGYKSFRIPAIVKAKNGDILAFCEGRVNGEGDFGNIKIVHMMSFVDGMTGTAGTVSIKYPVNNLYKNGAVRNDLLTKIITQKFIAQTPWLPLETWSDHRRLGLPFWDNVMLEQPIHTLPALTSSNYMTSNQQFFPQRMKYPSGLQNSNVNGYNQAVGFLGGADATLTPLWWAEH